MPGESPASIPPGICYPVRMSSPRPNPPRRSLLAVWHWPWWAWVIVVLLMLAAYPLSAGPAYWLLFHGYLPDDAIYVISVVYLPLMLAQERSEWVMEFLDWYMSLWIHN
jgi:hypothetical protein